MKKQDTWMKPRHRFITWALKPAFGAFVSWRYGIKVDPFKEQGDRQYLVLMNHQTAFDQFFIAMAFRGPVYYLASEDLFSKAEIDAKDRMDSYLRLTKD